MTTLEPVIGDAPVAVLLVDLQQRLVVHANSIAGQLAPGLTLPVDLDSWSDAAELRDPDGAELSDTRHPLSRVLRDEPVMGQHVTAARQSEMGRQREPLWVVALPMREAPALDGHALVVLLPMTNGVATPRLDSEILAAAEVDLALDAVETGDGLGAVVDTADSRFGTGSELRERALLATGLAFTVADAQDPEAPLVWVNPAFTRTTGYTFDEAVGRNCRFLQGPDTDPRVPQLMSDALQQGQGITSTLLNYTKDGLAFWNQVTISPIYAGDGELTHFVGIQTDVSGRMKADRERAKALAAERQARADAEAAQGRLRLLAEATIRLSMTLDLEECRAELIDLVVPDLADWVLTVHLDDHGRISTVDHRHRDPTYAGRLAQLAAEMPGGLREGDVHRLFLPDGQARLIGDLDSPASREARMSYIGDVALMDHTTALDSRSAIFVSLPGRRSVDDLMILVRGVDREPFTDDDLEVAADLGRRVGLILDNARLYTVQQHIAETLQRSLLPALPTLPRIRSAARYEAGELGAEVGGDFYELIELPDHRIGLAIGDVLGHDVFAAAAMGHLKGVLRACAYDAATSPSAVLERVDTLVAGLGMPTMATAVYAELAPVVDGWRVRWSSAGHLPLLVRLPDGTVELLTSVTRINDVMLGVAPGPRRESFRDLPHGSVLVGYTDGLVERRGEVLDVGLQRLVDTVSDAPRDVEELLAHLVAALGPSDGDDVVVVALELLPPD